MREGENEKKRDTNKKKTRWIYPSHTLPHKKERDKKRGTHER